MSGITARTNKTLLNYVVYRKVNAASLLTVIEIMLRAVPTDQYEGTRLSSMVKLFSLGVVFGPHIKKWFIAIHMLLCSM